MTEARQAEIAWAAGLFEGEGSWHLQKGTSPIASLGRRDRDVVEHFHRIMGIGRVYHRAVVGMWTWRATSKADVAAVIEILLPWMHERRAIKAREVLVACNRPAYRHGEEARRKMREAAKRRTDRRRSTQTGRFTQTREMAA